MVTRDRIQGETLRLLILPEDRSISRVFCVFKGPSGAAVSTDAAVVTTIIGSPWCVGAGGWIQSDFGALPATSALWAINQDTSAFAVGAWGAEVWVIGSDGGKTVLTRASFSIQQGLADASTGDVRTIAAKAVEAIEAYLSNPTNIAAGSYKINNRELTRYSLSDVRGLLGYWKTKLRNENIRASGRRGVIGRRINVIL